MKRDLLLINPPQQGLLNGFANGLIDLANFVGDREATVSISIADLAVTPPSELLAGVRSSLARFSSPPIVGITTTTASYTASLRTARAVKLAAPDCLVVLGGHHAAPEHETVLRRHSTIVDAVVRGEGERPLLALVRGTSPREAPGCSSWDHGGFRANPAPSLLTEAELDTLPVSFRSASISSDAGKFEHATYVSARGCPLHCEFCAVASTAVRSKSVARTIGDIRLLVESGHGKIAIEDNFFAQNKRRVLELCSGLESLQRERPFAWDCQTRVESMRSEETRSAFARAGCEAVYLGVESLDEEELVYLGKAANPRKYIEATFEVADRILQQPYHCYINLQLALPDETRDRRALRVHRLGKLGRLAAARGRTITVFPQLSVIYPGTLHMRRDLQRGTFGPLRDEVFEHFCEWESEEQPILRFLGANFAHGVGGIPLGLLDHGRLRERGQFEISGAALDDLQGHLRELEDLDGITLFKYGSHLFSAKTGASDTPSKEI
jgi:radical SAM superfamily enzyme YgiQ (UPF0313 family)